MKRSLQDIAPIITSHAVGQKRVLLSKAESGCGLTQIAVTDLSAGEAAFFVDVKYGIEVALDQTVI